MKEHSLVMYLKKSSPDLRVSKSVLCIQQYVDLVIDDHAPVSNTDGIPLFCLLCVFLNSQTNTGR